MLIITMKVWSYECQLQQAWHWIHNKKAQVSCFVHREVIDMFDCRSSSTAITAKQGSIQKNLIERSRARDRGGGGRSLLCMKSH